MKFLAKNIITILSLLVSITISITAYAYRSDQKKQQQQLDQERKERMVQDSILKLSLNKEIADRNLQVKNHEKKHIDEEVQRIEREKLKRDYFDAKFTGLEKLILSTKN